MSFNCRICLWTFESESELNIHNYLEHMIINHAEHKKIEDTCIAQVYHTNIHLVNSNNLIGSKSISQSRDEIESEVYDKFWSTKSLREDMDGIQSIIDKCEKHYNKTGDLPALKVVLDGYTSSREIVEEFEERMYSNGYGTTVSTFTPEQVAHLTRVTIDRLHYIIDEYMKGYDKTGNLGFLELASETRVDLQRITRQVEELRSYGYDIELTK
jgi:hypothetical protein